MQKSINYDSIAKFLVDNNLIQKDRVKDILEHFKNKLTPDKLVECATCKKYILLFIFMILMISLFKIFEVGLSDISDYISSQTPLSKMFLIITIFLLLAFSFYGMINEVNIRKTKN